VHCHGPEGDLATEVLPFVCSKLMTIQFASARSFALKKALHRARNLARGRRDRNGPDGRTPVHAIFLDIEMPGMDGSNSAEEFVKRGRSNHAVIFVTSHSDFHVPRQVSADGQPGSDGKPFLTFEVTVKALTLVLRGATRSCEAGLEPARRTPFSRPLCSSHRT